MIKFSVVLCSYNGINYIFQQIDSILAQSRWSKDCELIVSDDGSSDGTFQAVSNHYRERDDVTVIRNDTGKRGVVDNFECALSHASGRYLLLSDQDDVWLPNRLEILETHLAEGVSLLFNDLRVVDADLNVVAESFFEYQSVGPEIAGDSRILLTQNPAPGCSMVISRELLDIALPFPSGVIMHDWWLLLCANAFGQVVWVDSQLVLYRQHSMNQIGAKGFGVSSFFSAITKFNKTLNDFDAVCIQAEELQRLISSRGSESREAANLANWRSSSIVRRLKWVLLGDVRKNKWSRQLGLCLIAVGFGWRR